MISQKNQAFLGRNQQDSHELLVYLIELVHEELKINIVSETSFKSISGPKKGIEASFQVNIVLSNTKYQMERGLNYNFFYQRNTV